MAPVLITPLYHLENYPHVIHSIVRPGSSGTDEGDIETVLLRENGSQRVVIQDRDTVHAFMEIQDDSEALDDKNRMCWTHFEDMEHSVLCVLACPTQIRLWDKGSFLGGGEGTTIHLPCEATSIFPLETGILVQRRLVADDQQYQEDDDMVFLSKTDCNAPSTPLASLFSLKHPLKTLLPVANTNIMEQLVFVGPVDGIQISVTFHIELRRHAVWVLEDAPPTPSLSKSHDWKLEVDTTTTFVVEEDLLREDESFYEGVAGATLRKQALADALGVGTRPSGGAMLATPSILNGGIAPLHPDLSMTLVYEAFPKNPNIAKDVFLAGNFLCLNSGTELQVWNVQNKQVIPTASLPCLWALPIQCIPSATSRPETDLIVVNNGVQLYRGGRFIAEVAFDGNDAVIALRDPIGSRFTMELHNGARLRVDLSLTLSPLVERVLTALQAAAGDELALHMRLDCVRLIRDSAKSTIQDPSLAALSFVVKQVLNTCDNEIPESEISSWDMLVRSGYHSSYEEEFPFLQGGSIETKQAANSVLRGLPLQTNLYVARLPNESSIHIQIFDAIHLLYEDLKLSMLTKPWCQPIRSILRSCLTGAMDDFSQHYARDVGLQFEALDIPAHRRVERMTTFAKPPCIMSWVAKYLSGHMDDESWIQSSVVNSACPRMKVVHRAYSIMVSNSIGAGSIDIRRDEAVVKVLLEAGIEDPLFLQNDFPIGVALPLLEVLARCRCNTRIGELSDLSGKAWKFIGREDMFKQTLESGEFDTQIKETTESSENDHDGLVRIESSHALRFPTDNRLKEVARLLRSSKPSFLKVPRAVELSDHDYERLKQERLLTLCRRVLALPLGRGMFTLGTLRPVPAEQLPIPELCLSGRVPPTNNSLALDTSNTPIDMTVWPDFHNGVAAGLRLPPAGANSASFKITRSWIVYNRAASAASETSESGNHLTHAHGGLLMALGLRGHLSALSMTDIYEYLTQGSVTTSVGVLLGMAANKRGSCEPSVSKMLCLHIPSLLPLSFSSIDVSAPAHAAAVTGIGLLYQGSSHRLMTEFLLNEMGRRPIHDSSTIDREAYTLSCGLALGMITLAKGGSGSNAGLADLEIEQRLYRYIVGGVDDRANRRRQDTADRRVNTNGSAGGESERCSRVHEGDTINNDVTAPGALLALGLMYLKSGNKAVAAGLALPDTHFLLEYSRPDTLMLRVLARSLILWDEVEPASTWIEKQIPSVVRKTYLKMQASAKKTADIALGRFDHDMADEMSGSHQRSGSLSQGQQQGGRSSNLAAESGQDFQGDHDVDRQTVRQIHAYIVAGSCFSMGLRFAGTADMRAASAITEVLLEMKSFRDSNDPVPVALRPEEPIVGMCLGLCAVSLALVMAGTGDLETLRLFKTIRWRSDDSIRHGAHMATSASIGLLFLGGGMCTIGRSAEDIAALVAAFFPRFPMDSTDNKYHLQALRHMYALAVRQRHVQAFDVDSEEGVSVLVEARFNDSSLQPIQLTTPNLLTNTDSRVVKLVVQSDTYFPSSLCVGESNDGGVSIFVKKRTNIGDKQGSPSSCHHFVSGSKHGHTLLSKLRGKQDIYERDCRCPENGKHFCSDTVFDCISSPLSPPTLPVLGILGSIDSRRICSLAWDAAILQCYYERLGGKVHINELIDPGSAALIIAKVKRLLGPVHPWRSGLRGRSPDCMDKSS